MLESGDPDSTFQEQARAALDAKRSAERGLAAAVACPPWRHLLFGSLMGALIATPAFPPVARFAILAGILCAVALILRSDRKRLGVFINGYRRGKTRIVAVGVVAVELGLYALSVRYGRLRGDTLIPLLLAVLGVAIGTAGSILWQRVFRRELGA